MSQSDPDRTTLDAFVDGELPASEMTRIAALVAQRADLRDYVEGQERLRRTLRDSFAPLMNEALPERLQQSVQASALRSRAPGWAWRDGFREFFTWRTLGPAAAALAVGLFVGVAVDRFAATEGALLQSTASGQTVARGELSRALDEQLASTQNPADAVRVGLSFHDKNGRDCRTFTAEGTKNSLNGIACHSESDWVVTAFATTVPNSNARAPYQMAGAGMPDVIRDAVNDMIVGEPFDASAERVARASHWAGVKSR